MPSSHATDAGNPSVAYTYNLDDQLLTETGSGASAYTTTYGHPDGSGHIVGGYDLNGSLLEKHRTVSGTAAKDDTYSYDLRGRLSTSNETASGTITAATFTYTPSGDRLSETVTVNNGTPTMTNYLTDGDNPTGYSQVLEQSASAGGAPTASYLLGDAVLAQANAAGDQIRIR